MNNNKIDVIIGLDISTSVVGIAALEKQTGNYLKLDYEQLINKKKFPDIWSKIDYMNNFFATTNFIKPNWNVETIAVEEAMKRFNSGSSSANTILTLAGFNQTLCYLLYKQFNIKPTYINVRSARAKLGIKIDYKDKSKTTKQKVLDEIYFRNPNFPWIINKKTLKLTKVNEDMCDAYVIAEACRKK
jgi:hypothetical protein